METAFRPPHPGFPSFFRQALPEWLVWLQRRMVCSRRSRQAFLSRGVPKDRVLAEPWRMNIPAAVVIAELLARVEAWPQAGAAVIDNRCCAL